MHTETEIGMRLHDRATRGEVLTDAEARQLDAWYAQQDEVERGLIDRGESIPDLEQIQVGIASTLEKIAVVTRHIQEVSSENEALRRENAALKAGITRQPA